MKAYFARTMFSITPANALDYAAVFEDATEELHILGKLVPAHYQYTESADEVRLKFNNSELSFSTITLLIFFS